MNTTITSFLRTYKIISVLLGLSLLLAGTTVTYADTDKNITAHIEESEEVTLPADTPVIYPVDDNDTEVKGGGTPGYIAVITLPGRSPIEVTIGSDGNWSLTLPGGTPLNEGDVVRASQYPPGKIELISSSTSRSVTHVPVYVPPIVDEVVDEILDNVRNEVSKVLPGGPILTARPPDPEEETITPEDEEDEPKNTVSKGNNNNKKDEDDLALTDIEGANSAPLGSFSSRANWSLISLILSIISLMLAVGMTIVRKVGSDAKIRSFALCLVLSVLTVFVFVFLDDFSMPVGWISISTIPVFIFFIATLATTLRACGKTKDFVDEKEGN